MCILSTFSQFVGYNDEVLDVKFLGKADSHIVVATNSCQLKVFELLTNSCQILYGHTGESPADGDIMTLSYLHAKTPSSTCNSEGIMLTAECCHLVIYDVNISTQTVTMTRNNF